MRSTVLKGWLPFVNPFHSVRELLEEEEEEEEEEEYSHHQCTYSQQTNFVVGSMLRTKLRCWGTSVELII